MSATFFRKHCRHVWCAFVAGRDIKNGLLSQKCPQAGSVCNQENTFPLVEKVTTPTNHKMIWQTTWFGCWGTGGVVGGTAVEEWQQQWCDRDSEFWELTDLWQLLCYVVFGVVCLMCSGVLLLFNESEQGECAAECGAGREVLRSPEPEASPDLNVNSYI